MQQTTKLDTAWIWGEINKAAKRTTPTRSSGRPCYPAPGSHQRGAAGRAADAGCSLGCSWLCCSYYSLDWSLDLASDQMQLKPGRVSLAVVRSDSEKATVRALMTASRRRIVALTTIRFVKVYSASSHPVFAGRISS